eukprot:491982-Rhodomonas_salina.1
MDVFHASDLSGSVSPAAFPRVSGVGDHHIVVVWQHVEHLYRDDGEGFGAFASMFDLSRNQLSCIFLVNTEQKDQQVSPDVAAMGDTMFVVTLSSYNPGSSQLVGQMFDLSGAKLGTEFQLWELITRSSHGNPKTQREYPWTSLPGCSLSGHLSSGRVTVLVYYATVTIQVGSAPRPALPVSVFYCLVVLVGANTDWGKAPTYLSHVPGSQADGGASPAPRLRRSARGAGLDSNWSESLPLSA